MKIFWSDVETTGLDPVKNDIWQIAFEVQVNGEVVATHDFKMCPEDLTHVSPEALAIGGVTLDEIKSFPPAIKIFNTIKGIMREFVDPFKKGDKLIPAGYNCHHFDIPFIREFFRKMGDKYYGSWFSNYPLDVYHMAIAAHTLVGTVLPKYKLADVCAYHGIVISEAHNARYDIKATRELCYLLRDLYFKPRFIVF